MDFEKLVLHRESCRRFSGRPVDRAVITSCLEAARMAPSACNSQPWRFIVVDGEPARSELGRRAFSGFYRMNRFASHAPVLIVVMTEPSRYAARLGGRLRGVQYSLIDIGISCDHLTLRAAELGLATCWLGWFNEREAKRILHLPRRTRIDILISLGYPEHAKPAREKQRKQPDQIYQFWTPTFQDGGTNSGHPLFRMEAHVDK
jgi:nitroreductase